MANRLYGQNKADNAIDYGKSSAIILDAATTLTASQSGSTVLWNVAAAELTLPAAEAGLNFKVIIGVDATAGCTVVAASGDCFFGQIKVVSTTADQTEIQDIDYATAIAAPGSYDNLDFVSNSATLGGTSGDYVNLVAVDDKAWCASCILTSVHANPATIASINAG